MNSRRFPPPWSVEEQDACSVMLVCMRASSIDMAKESVCFGDRCSSHWATRAWETLNSRFREYLVAAI